MKELIKFISRKLLSIGKIRILFCYIRAFYFLKIRNNMKDLNQVTTDTWKNTLQSNKRVVFDKNINLPAKPKNRSIFDVGTSLAGGSANLLFEAIKKKYNKSEFKNLKILSIGPRAEGEIFNIFSYGFELKNIIGVDLFSYSPFIKLGDMHDLNFNDEEFDIVLMNKCLAYSNNKQKALSEAKRVLSKNGLLIIGYSVNKERTEQDQLKNRGYLVASPYQKINSMEELEELGKLAGFNIFFSKILKKKPGKGEGLVYGAAK